MDSKNNVFEVLVERFNGNIYLTTGWHALKDFCGVCLGSWVTMVFVGMDKFGIRLKDRFRRNMSIPRFTPPMIFKLEKQVVPFNNFHVLPSPFVHVLMKKSWLLNTMMVDMWWVKINITDCILNVCKILNYRCYILHCKSFQWWEFVRSYWMWQLQLWRLWMTMATCGVALWFMTILTMLISKLEVGEIEWFLLAIFVNVPAYYLVHHLLERTGLFTFVSSANRNLNAVSWWNEFLFNFYFS